MTEKADKRPVAKTKVEPRTISKGKISDVMKEDRSRGKRGPVTKARNEQVRLLRLFEKHLDRSTEAEFIAALSVMQPPVAPERFQAALQIFRENRRS
jgi:hypothetical protein